MKYAYNIGLTYIFLILILILNLGGCRTTKAYRKQADNTAYKLIEKVQEKSLGKTEVINIESAAETLRKRLLLDQKLPYKAPASLGIYDLPDNAYWVSSKHLCASTTTANIPWSASQALTLNLLQALQVSAKNNRDFQRAKEDLFRAALDLDLESDAFRSTFWGLLSGNISKDKTDGEAVSIHNETAEGGITQKFKSGIELSSRIIVDLVSLLTQNRTSSMGYYADASIAIPLLRGAGKKVAGEALLQAEKNLLYEVYEFERFKRIFAVKIASDYFSVLRQREQLLNVEENYKRLVAAKRRARRLADSGRLPEFQFDQAIQDELRARARWIMAKQNYADRLDNFKILLGLPPDANIDLDTNDLEKLHQIIQQFSSPIEPNHIQEAIPSADTPIILEEPRKEKTGPLELEVEYAIKLALDSRLDLKIAAEKVADAQRKVYLARDRLGPELTLLGQAQAGERRTSAAGAGEKDANLQADRGYYRALLSLDLPLERTAERNAYRNSIIELEQAIRAYQELEDKVKLEIRNNLRALLEAREGLLIQLQAVKLAERRVHSTDLFLQAGRAQIRDVLESQEALLNAQNSLTSAIVDYRISELSLQRDLGLLEVSPEGIWKEFKPEENK